LSRAVQGCFDCPTVKSAYVRRFDNKKNSSREQVTRYVEYLSKKMKKSSKKIIKLTASQILINITKLGVPFFTKSSTYSVSAKKFADELEAEESEIKSKIQYLKRHGYIEDFVEGKERYYEITPKGVNKIEQSQFEDSFDLDFGRWDGKWRIIIFDIPKAKNRARDCFRRKLVKAGFQNIQASVYVFPFECAKPIAQLSSELGLRGEVVVMISEIIQGEENLIKQFIDVGILQKADLSA